MGCVACLDNPPPLEARRVGWSTELVKASTAMPDTLFHPSTFPVDHCGLT